MVTIEQADLKQTGDGAAGPPFLSLVVPAYNEERRLGATLAVILSYLAGRPYTSEVLVVSDGSTDRTGDVARERFAGIAPDIPVRARLIEYVPNAGKGMAVRTGVATTTGQFVAFTDADLSTPIEEVDRALAQLQTRDSTGPSHAIVIGSRATQDAEIVRHQPLYRRLSARFFNVVRDGIVGIRGLRDTQCGLKVFTGPIARAIYGRQRIDGFMFDVETMFIAQRLGLPIAELGVRWTDAPESKVRLTSGFRIVPDLLRIRRLHGRLTPADLPGMLEAAGDIAGAAVAGATRRRP